MTPEELAEIKALVEKATPEPWVARGEGHMRFVEHPREAGQAYGQEILADDDVDYPTKDADIDFVAASRTIIPALLEHIEALQAQLQAANTRLADMQIAFDLLPSPETMEKFHDMYAQLQALPELREALTVAKKELWHWIEKPCVDCGHGHTVADHSWAAIDQIEAALQRVQE